MSRSRRMVRPLREFLETEAAGGTFLFVATVIALAWANSPVRTSYASFWGHELSIRLGRFGATQDLRYWVTDGLMTIFFFVVGLEIKREIVDGELSRARSAALPAVATIGGMLVPALLFLAVNHHGEAAAGWAVPMATDVAFALGALSLAGSRVPASLKVFLLSLAILDDIVSIIVIAFVFSGGIDWVSLAVAAGGLVVIVALRVMRVSWLPLYVAIGVVVWFTMLESGVHATLAGIGVALLVPAGSASRGSPVIERLEHALHPWSSFIVVPLFALANAGVTLIGGGLNDAFTSKVTWGMVVARALGKLAGITLFAWLGCRAGLAAMPRGVGFRELAAVAATAGIGFTVSLVVAALAFPAPALNADAKVGLLVGSLVAGGIAALLLTRLPKGDGAGGEPVTGAA